jgi:hypothetical protein
MSAARFERKKMSEVNAGFPEQGKNTDGEIKYSRPDPWF